MGLFLKNGTRVTQSSIDTDPDPDPLVVINTDLYQRAPYGANVQKNPAGDKLTLFCKANTVLRQSEVDLLFPDPVVDSITPATGTTTGGTVVTLKGSNLDGVTAVTFGGTAAASITVVSPTEVKVTTPAKTAGAVNVVVTDDGGSVTKTNGFTFA